MASLLSEIFLEAERDQRLAENSGYLQKVNSRFGEAVLDAAKKAALAAKGIASAVTRDPLTINWTTFPIDQRILYVMYLLVSSYRFPVNGASGLVGNLLAESGLIPNRLEGSSESTPMRSLDFFGRIQNFSAVEIMNRNGRAKKGPVKAGIGLAQWTVEPRRSELFKHTFNGKQLGALMLFHMEAQVDFLVKELKSSFPRVFSIITNPAVSVDDASDEVVYNFEIPGTIAPPHSPKLSRTHPVVQTEFKKRRILALRAFRVYKKSNP